MHVWCTEGLRSVECDSRGGAVPVRPKIRGSEHRASAKTTRICREEVERDPKSLDLADWRGKAAPRDKMSRTGAGKKEEARRVVGAFGGRGVPPRDENYLGERASNCFQEKMRLVLVIP